MYIATVYNAPDDYRLVSLDGTLAGCLRGANAAVAEDPALLRRLERGGMLVVEHFKTCGTYDQIRALACRHAQETYDRTRATVDSEHAHGGPGDQSPAGPPASGNPGDAKGTP